MSRLRIVYPVSIGRQISRMCSTRKPSAAAKGTSSATGTEEVAIKSQAPRLLAGLNHAGLAARCCCHLTLLKHRNRRPGHSPIVAASRILRGIVVPSTETFSVLKCYPDVRVTPHRKTYPWDAAAHAR